jgi:hypothetical protein
MPTTNVRRRREANATGRAIRLASASHLNPLPLLARSTGGGKLVAGSGTKRARTFLSPLLRQSVESIIGAMLGA